MNNYGARQQMSFPEVATIRKGLPKIEMEKDGKKFFGITNNHDLKNKFRISFSTGTNEVKEIYKQLHPKEYTLYDMSYRRPGVYAEKDGFETEVIRARVPCFSVFDAFTWANEAHNGGTRIAVCDDEHFISLKNPLNTKEYQISNGEPYREFHHGDTLSYERNGKRYQLPFKSNLRLSLFLPELVRFVYFTLKSTSIYDRWQIDAQLSGIQFWANTLNNGNAAGIPMVIYRRETDVTWNKPDGSAQQTKQWLINVEADPEWVASAIRRMGQMALTGDAQKMLQAPAPAPVLEGTYNPFSIDEEDTTGDGEEDITGEGEATAAVIEGTVKDTEPAGEKKATDAQKYKANGSKIVALVAEIIGCDNTAAAQLVLAKFAITDMITLDEARAFAEGKTKKA